MKLPHLVAVGLFASLGVAQAQPVAETPGISPGTANPTAVPSAGTNTPAGVIQGAVPPTGQGSAAAAAGTVPIAPSPGVPPQGEARNPGPPAQTGLAPGDRARDALGMGAGVPGTSMPAGSIAGQAPGMGATPQGNPSQGVVRQGIATPGTAMPNSGTTSSASPNSATPSSALPNSAMPHSGAATSGATPPPR